MPRLAWPVNAGTPLSRVSKAAARRGRSADSRADALEPVPQARAAGVRVQAQPAGRFGGRLGRHPPGGRARQPVHVGRAADDQKVGPGHEVRGGPGHRDEGHLVGGAQAVRDVAGDDVRVPVHRFVHHQCPHADHILCALPSAQPAPMPAGQSLRPLDVGTKVGQDRGGHRADGGGDRWRQARALGQVARLDRVHDQARGHPVKRHGQRDRVIQAEAVRAGRPSRSGARSVYHETMHGPRVRRFSADRVDDDRDRRSAPGLDEPGGLAVGDHQADAGRRQVIQDGDDRGAGAVVAAELVADADHHDRVGGREAGS